MELGLDWKTAVITGGTRGIGKAIATQLAHEGCYVHLLSRSGLDESGHEPQAPEGARGWHVHQCDVTDSDAVNAVRKKVTEQAKSIDILINNAGVPRDNLLMRMSDEEWDTVIDTNLNGARRVTQTFLRDLQKAAAPRVISISSIFGLTGQMGQANYAAAKAGLIALTKTVAKEAGSRGLTANVICPGLIETDMTRNLPEDLRNHYFEQCPLGRTGSGQDIAGLVAFLCSPLYASYITGQVITVDGGFTL